MRRAKLTAALLAFSVTLLVTVPMALAATTPAENGGGQGWYGETTDKSITTAMFIVIAFFPTVILIFSLIQARLDRRKHARMEAAKRRAASHDWRGGW